jgi:CBS domain-containing membrane protein
VSLDEKPASPSFKRSLEGLKNGAMQFLAVPLQVDAHERWRAFLGAGFGIFITAWLSRWWGDSAVAATWLVAPMGASAVLVFAMPASPMAQPWSVLMGHFISALVGVTCALYIGDPVGAASVAVGLALALMFVFRCVHPPGGATALLAVLLHTHQYRFALYPVLVNALLLVLSGVVYNTLTGRPYPHAQRSLLAEPQETARFSNTDLDTALAHYNQVLDVSRDDLAQLLHYAELASYQRHLGELRCADIMLRDPLSVQFGTSLSEAWKLMRQQHLKALPVVDRTRRIVGIVTAADFLRQVDMDELGGIGQRFRAMVQRSGSTHSDKPEVVGQIMTRKVQVASMQRHAIDLVPLFSTGGHQHIPVMDAENRLVGLITQSDLVRALYQAVKPTTGG